jgi:hypothetical protein
MEQKHQILLRLLAEASAKGFKHDFRISSDGIIHFCTEEKQYEHEDVHAEVGSYPEIQVSIHLITTPEGFKGTAIDFWEHY